MVRFHTVAMAIVRLGGVNHVILEEFGVCLEFVVFESSTNLGGGGEGGKEGEGKREGGRGGREGEEGEEGG